VHRGALRVFDIVRKYRGMTMLGVYLLVAIALTLLERRATQRSLGPFGTAAFHATASTQDFLHYSMGGLGDAWGRYMDLVRVGDENARLREELDRLREEHTRLLGVMQENARLRAMVGFAESHSSLELAPARVIAKEVTPFFRVVNIRIDVGSSRVEPGQPVVSSAGVVGHVSDVTGRYAEVILAADPRSSIDVLVQRNRARGIVEGLGHSDSYDSRVAYLTRRDEVREGDIVVTSGMCGRYPPDLVVGRVARVDDRTHGLFQEVVVASAVDFSRLEEVFVIVSGTRR